MEILKSLFPSLGREGFLLEKYPSDVCIAQDGLSRLGELNELAGTDFVEILGRSRSCSDFLIYEQGSGVARQGRHRLDAAREFLQAGHPVTIEDGEEVFPQLKPWRQALALELGLVGPVAPPSIIISPKGSRVPVHHDGVELLVVHLQGKKRWWYRPHDQQDHIDYTYFPSEGGPGPRGGTRPRHRAMTTDPLLEESGHSVVLEPGHCLFLPRGWWHQTEALTDTLNIIFRLQTKPAYWVVAEAIADVLRQNPLWRKPIPGLRGDEGLRMLATRSLADLAPHLVKDLDLAEFASPQALLRPLTGVQLRRTQSSFEIQERSDNVAVNIIDKDGSRTERYFPLEWQSALLWLLERVRPFTESDFHWASGLPTETGADLLRGLIGMGALNASGSLYFS